MKIERLYTAIDSIDKINELVDAINAMLPKEERIADLEQTNQVLTLRNVELFNRLCEKTKPNADPKPELLRDGDVGYDQDGSVTVCTSDKSGFYFYFTGDNDHDGVEIKKILFNILDLAAAVQRGEVIVSLTRDEAESIIHYSHESDPLAIKLRKAMEAK